MRILRPMLVLCLAGNCAARADDRREEAPAPIRAQMAQLIAQSVLAARSRPAADGAATPRGEAVVMPAFTVTDDYRRLDQAVDDWDRKMEADRFTWRGGGTYKRIDGPQFTTEFELRFDPEMHGVDFLRISW